MSRSVKFKKFREHRTYNNSFFFIVHFSICILDKCILITIIKNIDLLLQDSCPFAIFGLCLLFKVIYKCFDENLADVILISSRGNND